MTVAEATARAVAAARGPSKRESLRAKIAENTLIANEWRAIEAAANETKVADALSEGHAPKAKAKTVQPAAPRCMGSSKEHGPLVERYRGSLLGGTSKVMMCDACYLFAERLLAKDQACDDAVVKAASGSYGKWHGKPARVGFVPQCFGDERLGGIWAARGMR